MIYAPFVPPAEVAMQRSHDWDAKQRRLYREWFMSEKDERLQRLATVSGLTVSFDKGREALVRFGEWSLECTKDHDLVCGLRPTPEGYGLACDIGVLVCEMLCLSAGGQVRWQTITSPKSHIWFGLVGLVVGRYPVLEPVNVGANNFQAQIAGKATSDVWVRLFDAGQRELAAGLRLLTSAKSGQER